MKTLSRNQSGFGAVEALLIIVIIAIIGAVGAYVYKNHSNKAAPTSTNIQKSTAPATTNPYAGWKSYCDTTSKLCFKYPSDWTVNDGSAPAGIVQTVINPSATADIQYGNLLPSVGEPTTVFTSDPLSQTAPPANVVIDISGTYSFYVASISNVSSGSNYKVVGGYYVGASENIPSYFVVNASTITKQTLKVGQISKLQDNAFNISNNLVPNHIILIGGGPITETPYTATQAKSWLNSTNGKAIRQLLNSFYSQ